MRDIVKKNINDYSHLFCCPKCGEGLASPDSEFKLICHSCSKEWHIDDNGVIRMQRDDYTFSLDQKGMFKLLNELRGKTEEWLLHHVNELERKYRDFNYDYCLNPSRADWTIMGDFSNKTVSELGCGYGSVSIPLAERNASMLIPVDATLERIKFLSLIARMKKLANIIPLHSDVLELPLTHQSFDKIVIVGLLEYASGFNSYVNLPVKKRQIDYIKNISNLLREKGEIWIGIENRLSPIHFWGASYHGELPFTPLLPRVIANVFHKLVKKHSFDVYLLTKKGYGKLLEKAGLHNTEFYYAFPNYKIPKFISSTDKNGIITKYIDSTTGFSKKYRISMKIVSALDRFNLAGMFFPSFFIRARKSDSLKSVGIREHVRRYFKVNDDSNLEFILHSGSRGKEGYITLIFYRDSIPFLVGRVSRSRDTNRLRDEYEILKKHQSMFKQSTLLSTLEVPYSLKIVVGNMILFKQYKPGLRADKLILENKKREEIALGVLRASSDWLIMYLDGTREYRNYNPEVKIEKLKGFNTDSATLKQLEFWIEDDRYFLAPSHGDLIPSNILMEDLKISGIIDFENYTNSGIPIADFLGLIVSIGTTIYGLNQKMVENTFFKTNRFSKEVRDRVIHFCDHFDLSINDFAKVIPVYSERAISLCVQWGMNHFEKFHTNLKMEFITRNSEFTFLR